MFDPAAAWPALRVFAAAFVLDWIYVLWIRARDPHLLALYSGGIALLGVIGLGGALQGHPVAYVLGYSAGSYAVGIWTQRGARAC